MTETELALTEDQRDRVSALMHARSALSGVGMLAIRVYGTDDLLRVAGYILTGTDPAKAAQAVLVPAEEAG